MGLDIKIIEHKWWFEHHWMDYYTIEVNGIPFSSSSNWIDEYPIRWLAEYAVSVIKRTYERLSEWDTIEDIIWDFNK